MIEVLSILTTIATAVQSGVQTGADIYNGYQQRKLDRSKFAEECRQQELTRKARIEEQNRQFEELKKKQITDYFLQHSWPLSITPHALNEMHSGKGIIPLRVFIAPFLNDNFKHNNALDYAKHSLYEKMSLLARMNVSHKIEYLFDIWKEGQRGMQSELQSLYSILKGQPTLVLFPRITNSDTELIIYGALWGIGDVSNYPKIERLETINLKKLYISCAREYAKRWRDTSRTLTPIQTEKIQSVDAKNLLILEQDEKLKGNNFTTKEFDEYFSSSEDYLCKDDRFNKAIGETVANHLTVLISAAADIYSYIEYKTIPRLAIILAYLHQPFYTETITPKYIGIYNSFNSLIGKVSQGQNTLINYLDNKNLWSIIYSCTKNEKISDHYSNGDFVTRLLWDEYTSECFRDYLLNGKSDVLNTALYEQMKRIFGELESNLSDKSVRVWLDNIIQCNEFQSILFSFSIRHSTIREVKTRSERASYILYEKTQVKGGVNWLVTINLASTISNIAKTNKRLNTPSLVIYESKDILSKELMREYKKYGITLGESIVTGICSYGRFIENIRILSDIIYNH